MFINSILSTSSIVRSYFVNDTLPPADVTCEVSIVKRRRILSYLTFIQIPPNPFPDENVDGSGIFKNIYKKLFDKKRSEL